MKTVQTFSDLGVPAPLVATLKRTGIDAPFPIQAATLPDAIARRDILARGQTGSGKTLAFGLAMLARLQGRKAISNKPAALILVPTRELAMQVNDTLVPLADSLDLRIRPVVGGVPYVKQTRAISRGVHILVATPGRLIDLAERGDVDLSDVEITVLDEADQMADMGFMPAVRELLDQTRPNGQRLLFSATLDKDVDLIVRNYLRNPSRHSLAPAGASIDAMSHHVFVVHPKDKDAIVAKIAARDGKTILFVRTQLAVERTAKDLAARGIPTGGLHGGKSQAVRTRTLEAFRSGTTKVLVATDVAARGIHVDEIDMVLHVDAPKDPKEYVHRAGRTARAGRSGTVVTLTSPRQEKFVSSMQKRAGVKATVTRMRIESVELADIAGAQEPSGIAWHAPADKPKQAKKRSGRPRKSSASRRPSKLDQRVKSRNKRHARDEHAISNDSSRRRQRDEDTRGERPSRRSRDAAERGTQPGRPRRSKSTDRSVRGAHQKSNEHRPAKRKPRHRRSKQAA